MRYQEPQSKNSHFHIVVGLAVIAVVVFGGYNYVTTNEAQAQATSSLVTPDGLNAPSASPFSTVQLNLLKKIEAIKLDGTILRDPSFVSLQDNSVDFGQEDAGKLNPFIPLPGSAAAQIAPSKTPAKK